MVKVISFYGCLNGYRKPTAIKTTLPDAPGRNRTPDTRLRKPLLCPLSYRRTRYSLVFNERKNIVVWNLFPAVELGQLN